MRPVPLVLAMLLTTASGVSARQQREGRDTTAAERDTTATSVPRWLGRLQVLGTLEGEFRWARYQDITQAGGGSASDLYVRRLEIAVDGKLSDLAEALFVVNTEYLGLPGQNPDGAIVLDEGHINVAGGDTSPFYMIFGLQTQPFGLFESHSVTDPMTQDAYEIKKVGLVMGYSGPSQLDLSLTGFKGGALMAGLFGSGLFDAALLDWQPRNDKHVDSFIASGKITPIDDYLDLFTSLASEPGRGRRNVTLDAGLTLAAPRSKHLLLDTEYAKALQREAYPAAPHREFLEGVLSSTLTYRFVVREREHKGVNFKARRSRIASHPVEISARFEHFDDGGLSRDLGLWSVRNRLSIGGRYTIEDQGGGSFYFLGEYRRTSLRGFPGAPSASVHDGNGEIYLKTGIVF